MVRNKLLPMLGAEGRDFSCSRLAGREGSFCFSSDEHLKNFKELDCCAALRLPLRLHQVLK